MTDRQEAWRQRQRAVLTALRKASKRNRTAVAEHAGLEYWQVVRLETGKARLPADLIPDLARGYQTTPEKIIAALELVPASAYDPRQAMEAHGTFTAERMDQIEREVKGKHPAAQKARIDEEAALGPDRRASVPDAPTTRRRRIG